MSNARLHLDTKISQMLSDKLRGTKFAIGQLGVGMNVSPPSHYPIGDGRHFVGNGFVQCVSGCGQRAS